MKKESKTRIMARYAFIVGCTLVIVIACIYKLTVTVFVEGSEWNKRCLRSSSSACLAYLRDEEFTQVAGRCDYVILVPENAAFM